MNKHEVCSRLLATLAVGLTLLALPAMAAKPGGGGTPDPCTTAVDFPAFAFWRPNGKTQQIYVADSDGKCIRSVASVKSGSGGGGSIQFSYPVTLPDNSVVGRVVWVEAPAVVGVDFTVAAGTNQITVKPKRTLYTGTGGGISLSGDGQTLYSTRFLGTGEIFIDKLALDTDGAVAAAVFQTATTNEYIGAISVSGDEKVLYADYKPSSGVSPVYQLVSILLPGGSISVLDSNNSSREFSPAVDPRSPDYNLAYQRGESTAAPCGLLVTSSWQNAFVSPAQPAYGLKPTWLNSKILADGRAASTRNGCTYTGTIMQTDPVSGVQTALTSGYDPDGK